MNRKDPEPEIAVPKPALPHMERVKIPEREVPPPPDLQKPKLFGGVLDALRNALAGRRPLTLRTLIIAVLDWLRGR